MKLSEIPLADVHAGKNWFVEFPEGGDPNNPDVQEESMFAKGDLGLFSGLLKFADGSKHPALALKSFENDGAVIASFVYTRMGWMALEAPGIMRLLGKYSHDVFPYDLVVANPVESDLEIGPKAGEHRAAFQEALEALKALKYDPVGTATRKRILGS